MSWGAIGGAAASVVIGGVMAKRNADKAGSSSSSQSTSSKPFRSRSSLFSVSYGPARALSPELREKRRRMVEQRGKRAGKAGKPQEAVYMSATKGRDAGYYHPTTGAYLGTSKPAGMFGGGGGGISRKGLPGGGNSGLQMSILDPRLRKINKGALAGSQQALGLSRDFLGALSETDPMAIQQAQFDLLNPLLQKQQQEDFLGLESRLFAQGQLGGGGFSAGNNQLNALFDAQADQETKLLFDSYNQGLATQNHLFNLSQGLQGVSQGFLQMPLAIQESMLAQAQVAGGLSGANTVGQVNAGGASLTGALGAGLMNQGVQGLTQGFDKLFQPSAGQSPYTNNTINGYTSTTAGR